MIEVGKTIIAKPKFLIEHDIPYENRKFKVLASSGRNFGSLVSIDGEYKYAGTLDFVKDFYIQNNVNLEIMMLLDSDVQITSFQAVTEDGKVIQIEGR